MSVTGGARHRRSVLLVVAAVMGFGGCNRPLPPDVPSMVHSAAPARSVVLYVDDSVPMQGFVQRPISRYRQVVATVIEHLVATQLPHEVVRVSDVLAPTAPRPLDPVDVFSGSFYRAAQPPLVAVVDGVTRRRPRDEIVVLVSDFAHSAAGVQSALIEAFRSAAAARPAVLLLGYRSAFRGTYTAVTTGTNVRLDLDAATQARTRPFYMLVLAPSRKSLEQFRSDVLDHVRPLEEFYASEPPISVDKMDLVNGGAFVLYARRASFETSFVGTFAELPRGKTDVAELQIRVTGERKLPMLSLTRIRHEVSRAGGTTGEWLPVTVAVKPAAETVASPVNDESDKISFVLVHRFPRAPRKVWEMYRVRTRAGSVNTSAPPWVVRWTTDDERRTDLTLGLRRTIDAMMRAITDDVILVEHYIRLQWS